MKEDLPGVECFAMMFHRFGRLPSRRLSGRQVAEEGALDRRTPSAASEWMRFSFSFNRQKFQAMEVKKTG